MTDGRGDAPGHRPGASRAVGPPSPGVGRPSSGRAVGPPPAGRWWAGVAT
ncbi:hypothetical protein [Micromonospora sp. NPDC057141]